MTVHKFTYEYEYTTPIYRFVDINTSTAVRCSKLEKRTVHVLQV